MVYAIDDLLPVFCSIYVWRVDFLIFIPGFLEEDTADTMLCKIEGIRRMIIDHEADREISTDSRFWLRVFTIVIHEVDSIFWYSSKVVANPAESLLFFYRIIPISCSHYRAGDSSSLHMFDALSR